MITVKYVDMMEQIKGFTVFDGDYAIIINANLNVSDKTSAYATELKNIEEGVYRAKLLQYVKELIL
jgi:hypothetical protein